MRKVVGMLAMVWMVALTAEDREAITRVVIHEAGNEPVIGQLAVVEVIRNRVESGEFGEGVNGVVNKRAAFEPVLRHGGNWRNLPPGDDRRRAYVRAILDLYERGALKDQTGGATHFQNREIVAKRQNGHLDFGGMPVTATIGQHTFYAEKSPQKLQFPPIYSGQSTQFVR